MLQMITFYTIFCEPSVSHIKVCSTSTTLTSEHRTILMLTANVVIKSTSASAFGLVSQGTLSWAPTYYLTDRLLKDIIIFWKLFYQGCLKMCLQLWGRDCGFSMIDLQCTMGNMQSNSWTQHIQKGEWKWMADHMAFSVIRSNSDGLFLV